MSDKDGSLSRTTPVVTEGRLYDPGQPATSIRVDSPAWFAWLEAATTHSFSYRLVAPTVGYVIGVLTVRKERRQRGGAYWVGDRRSGGRIQTRYVGRSAMVTHIRRAEVARGVLAAHHGADQAGGALEQCSAPRPDPGGDDQRSTRDEIRSTQG